MKIENIKSLAITGANSYVGRNLIKLCIEKKIKVKAFCRSVKEFEKFHLSNDNLEIHKYEISRQNIIDLSNVDGLVHLAHERIQSSRRNFINDNNIIATKNIIESAKKYNINKVVFLSSHLAHNKTLSQYGKSKLMCEKFFLENNFIVIQAGFVFGGEVSGFLKLLITQFKKKIFPIIFPQSPIYPIHVTDLNNSLLFILNKNNLLKKKYILGDKNPMKLKDFFNKISIKYCKKNINFISLPGNIIFKVSSFFGYFFDVFNKIYERAAGVKSLIILDTDRQIDDDINYLLNTKSFLNNDE